MNLKELTNNKEKNINITFDDIFLYSLGSKSEYRFHFFFDYIILKLKLDFDNLEFTQNQRLYTINGYSYFKNGLCSLKNSHNSQYNNISFGELQTNATYYNNNIKYKRVIHFKDLNIIFNSKNTESVNIHISVYNSNNDSICIEYIDGKNHLEHLYHHKDIESKLKCMTRNININAILS